MAHLGDQGKRSVVKTVGGQLFGCQGAGDGTGQDLSGGEHVDQRERGAVGQGDDAADGVAHLGGGGQADVKVDAAAGFFCSVDVAVGRFGQTHADLFHINGTSARTGHVA